MPSKWARLKPPLLKINNEVAAERAVKIMYIFPDVNLEEIILYCQRIYSPKTIAIEPVIVCIQPITDIPKINVMIAPLPL